MSLFIEEEVCYGCVNAIFHDCCGKFCRCKIHREDEINHTNGQCDYKKEKIMIEIRVHNSEKKYRTYKGSIANACHNYKQTIGYKPKGIWYGFDTSWHDWCRQEQLYSWLDGADYEVCIPNHLNILQCSTADDLFSFTREYNTTRKYNTSGIDWTKVIKDYDGIEINPYIWSCRSNYNTMWYYGWDCASGCVWNAKEVKFKLIRRKNSLKTIDDVLFEYKGALSK